MESLDIMYDESEDCAVRYVGFIGENSHYDLIIVTTQHFFGKKLVISTQTGRMAILTAQEAEDSDYIATSFSIDVTEATELSAFLSTNL